MTREKFRKFLGKKFFGKAFFLGRGYPLKKSGKFWGKNFWKRVPLASFGFLGKIYREQLCVPFLGCTPWVGREGVYPLGVAPVIGP